MTDERAYGGPERRKFTRRDLAACPDPSCNEAINEMRAELHRHIEERAKALEEKIADGFPNGDPRSHRLVHEGYIREAEERAALRKTVVERTVTGVVWAGIVFVAIAVWEYFKGIMKS